MTFPGILRIATLTTWTLAAALAGALVGYERGRMVGLVDLERAPWMAGTWAVER